MMTVFYKMDQVHLMFLHSKLSSALALPLSHISIFVLFVKMQFLITTNQRSLSYLFERRPGLQLLPGNCIQLLLFSDLLDLLQPVLFILLPRIEHGNARLLPILSLDLVQHLLLLGLLLDHGVAANFVVAGVGHLVPSASEDQHWAEEHGHAIYYTFLFHFYK